METLTFRPGQTILHKGEAISGIYLISAGSVMGSSEKGDIFLSKGDVLAVFDIFNNFSLYDYVASEAVVCMKYPLDTPASLLTLLRTKPDLNVILASTATKMCCSIMDDSILQTYNCNQFYASILDSYRNYTALCAQHKVTAKTLPEIEELSPFSTTDVLPDYISGYYEAVRDLASDIKTALFWESPDFTYGFLHKAAQDTHRIHEYLQLLSDYQADNAYLLLNANGNDLFDLYTTLCVALERRRADTMSLNAIISKLMIQMEGQISIDRALYQKRIADFRNRVAQAQTAPAEEEDFFDAASSDGPLADATTTILEYSDYSADDAASFVETLTAYKKLADRSSTEEYASSLRKKLTHAFYEMYTTAFQYSLKDKNTPIAVKMFLLFGFIDEGLAGKENAAELMDLADELFHADNMHVFTLFSWLKAIYYGKKEPSRNEFDSDYSQYLHELKVSGKITAEMEAKMLKDSAARVMYELQNMFPTVNKITSGRISTFCPFFSEHNCLHKPSECIVTVDKIKRSLTFIRSIDFRAYYRDNLFTLPEAGINHENLQLEVLPDIILMPNTGVRGALWQEIEGRRRTTPSRMMLPLLCQEDVTALLTRLTGEFRWEMCKRVQGSRWNDVSDPSLTSEYFDYIQFYKKNSDLSPDAKEKIKTGLSRAKNSFKEMFVRDYIQWVYFEGTGSPRLNKVVRKILFKYCPFAKAVRDKLDTNPMYKEVLDYYRLHNGQAQHRVQMIIRKIENSHTPVPDEITRELMFLQM